MGLQCKWVSGLQCKWVSGLQCKWVSGLQCKWLGGPALYKVTARVGMQCISDWVSLQHKCLSRPVVQVTPVAFCKEHSIVCPTAVRLYKSPPCKLGGWTLNCAMITSRLTKAQFGCPYSQCITLLCESLFALLRPILVIHLNFRSWLCKKYISSTYMYHKEIIVITF